MFQYNPKDAVTCNPPGRYQATIEKAEETESKAHNPIVVLTFKVYRPSGTTFTLTEYIVAATVWKLKKISKVIGGEAAFDKGHFEAADYVGRNLELDVTVEFDEKYGDQNRIKSYYPLTNG